MKIAVIGGGLTGLTAAFRLTQKGQEVTLFEKENQLGGLAASFKKEGWDWAVEHYFHHFFASDQAVKNLARQLNLEKKLFFHQPKTSLYLEGKIFRFDNPQSLLSFPKLGLTDKLRTGATTLFLKTNPFWQPLEKLPATTFIQKTMGQKAFSLIWQPLFLGKFRSFAEQIPASWFWARIKKRSSTLGYFMGGTETLITTLAEKIKKSGGQIFLGQEISRIQKTATGLSLFSQNQNSEAKFEKVIATVPPATLAKLAVNLSASEKKQLLALKSLGSLCLVLALKESFLIDGTYWLNINERNFPFVAVVEHTNFIDKKNYQQNTLLYVGGYYPSDHPFFQQTKDTLLKKFLPYLQKINPNFNFNQKLIDCWLFKDFYSQPVVSYRSQNQLSSKTSVSGLYWATLHHIYPEDRGVNYAILLGEKVADETVS